MKKSLLFILILGMSKLYAQTTCSAEFTTSKSNEPCNGQPAEFSVTGPGGVSFTTNWDFGNGTSSSANPVSFTYVDNGTGGWGNLSHRGTVTIRVSETAGGFSEGYSCLLPFTYLSSCFDIPPPTPTDATPPGNPFLTGEEGNWRVKRTWVLQMERTQTRSTGNDNLNLRTDGIYKRFYIFWNPTLSPGAMWTKYNDNRWTFKTQINHYNPFGTFELESVDPLNRYSAAIYGYNYTLPIAVAANSRYREIAFDSFEDYDFGRCKNNHFSFQFVNGIEEKINETNSHSGRRSIRLAPDETVIMKKQFVDCEDETTPNNSPE